MKIVFTSFILPHEIDDLEINLKDGELNNVKALFARLCFCRGQTGYYTLNQGQIAIKKLSENQYHLKMRFKFRAFYTARTIPKMIKLLR